MCGTGWPVLAELVLLDEKVEVSLEAGTIHGDLVSAAFLHTFIFVWYKYICCRIVGVLHFAEGGLNSASSDRLVGLPEAYKE